MCREPLPRVRRAEGQTTHDSDRHRSCGAPNAVGLVTSMARPDGNLTGVSATGRRVWPSKRFDLLVQCPARPESVSLVNPAIRCTPRLRPRCRKRRERTGSQLWPREPPRPRDDEAFALVVEGKAGALVIQARSNHQQPSRAARWRWRRAMPCRRSTSGANSPSSGGLLSYGPSNAEDLSPAGVYAGRILKGAKPADLPVVQPTTFELIVNMKTAKALGLDIPPTILARADEMIE